MTRFGRILVPGLVLCVALPLLGTLLAQTPKPRSLEKTIAASRWKNRLLLIAAANDRQADFQQQKALLAAQETELAARDFLVIPVLYGQLSAADQQLLKRQMGLNPPAFAAVLIGKDGGVKAKSSRPMKPEALFSTVDKMPMRRDEIKRSR